MTQYREFGEEIANYVLSLPHTVEDTIKSKSKEVKKARKDADTLEEELNDHLLEFSDISGTTEKLRQKGIKYFDALSSCNEKALKLLRLRKGVLTETLKEWRDAEVAKRHWFEDRNEKMSQMKWFWDEVPLLMNENEHILNWIDWYLKTCERN